LRLFRNQIHIAERERKHEEKVQRFNFGSPDSGDSVFAERFGVRGKAARHVFS